MIDAAGLRARASALRALRGWFDRHGYLEVPTPALVPSPAMEEHLFAVRAADGWLRTSPEFALKRVVASGLPRIYEIGPCWRERESGPWHGREFLMLEWYRVGASTADLMDEVEQLVTSVAEALGVPGPAAWERVTVREAFQRATSIDLATAGVQDMSDRDDGWDDAFFRRWVEDVEPSLEPAVFVHQWPASQAALSRTRDDGLWPWADRFEVFLDGVELANAFLELTNGPEQRRRFASANAERISAGEAPHPVDEALVTAVGTMPTTAGIALGVDRLVAALLGWDGIAPGRVG